MNNKRFLLAINGILTGSTGPESNWAQMTPGYVVGNRMWDDAAAFAYTDGVVGASSALERQAGLVLADLEEVRSEYGVVDVLGHSNAGRLGSEVLKRGAIIDTLGLAAAALEADCELNGLNDAARKGRVRRVVLFISPNDGVLNLPGAYGRMGMDGPSNVCPELREILRCVYDICKHCDWVGNRFEKTLQEFHELASVLPPRQANESSSAQGPAQSNAPASTEGGA